MFHVLVSADLATDFQSPIRVQLSAVRAECHLTRSEFHAVQPCGVSLVVIAYTEFDDKRNESPLHIYRQSRIDEQINHIIFMGDPIPVVGLISGVITFIDFGLKVVAESKKLHNSAARGASDEISELDRYVVNIHEWNEEIKRQQLSGLQLSKDERRILGMVRDCEKLVDELREVIETLQIQDGARSKKLETARVAFQRRWKSGDLQNLRTRLRDLDEQIRRNVEHIMQS